jgi:hypothetical protein
MATAEWVTKVEIRAESNRRLNNIFCAEDFVWTHLPCGDVVKETVVKNSNKNDSASGDPIPVFGYKLHCNKHNVSSLMEIPPQREEPQLVEETQGE